MDRCGRVHRLLPIAAQLGVGETAGGLSTRMDVEAQLEWSPVSFLASCSRSESWILASRIGLPRTGPHASSTARLMVLGAAGDYRPH